MTKIKMKRDLMWRKAGSIQAVPSDLAEVWIREGIAEPVVDDPFTAIADKAIKTEDAPPAKVRRKKG